jgi:hypothetical protein
MYALAFYVTEVYWGLTPVILAGSDPDNRRGAEA